MLGVKFAATEAHRCILLTTTTSMARPYCYLFLLIPKDDVPVPSLRLSPQPPAPAHGAHCHGLPSCCAGAAHRGRADDAGSMCGRPCSADSVCSNVALTSIKNHYNS